MTLQTFLKRKRLFEVLFWVCFCVFLFTANIIVIAMDNRRAGNDIPLWEPAVWEASSIIVILSLIPLILAFDSRVPLRWRTFPKSTIQHILFSAVFSVIHVALMVSIRKVVYYALGSSYRFGPLPREMFYEYLKDFRTYFLIIALVYLYRFIVLRLQGEASVLGQTEGTPEKADRRPLERLLVKKLGKEFLIHIKDIGYIEAAGNYVNIHIGERTYPLRETMTKICNQLDETDFRRVHRSYVVNINAIREIQPLDSGDAIVILTTNKQIPVSRTYRSALTAV